MFNAIDVRPKEHTLEAMTDFVIIFCRRDGVSIDRTLARRIAEKLLPGVKEVYEGTNMYHTSTLALYVSRMMEKINIKDFLDRSEG